MSQTTPMPEQLLNTLRELIQQGRQRVLRAVNMVQVQTRTNRTGTTSRGRTR